MTSNGRCLAGLLGAMLLCYAGCGGDGALELSGKVTLDGAPIERGTIRFMAEDGSGAPSEASITNGTYSLRLPPGKKKVSILGYKKIGEHHIQGPESPLIDDLEQIVPPQYNEQTTLVEDVQKTDPAKNFDLKRT